MVLSLSSLGVGEVVAVGALDALVLVQQQHVDPQVLHGRPHEIAALALQVELDLVRMLVFDVPLQEPPLGHEVAVRTLTYKNRLNFPAK